MSSPVSLDDLPVQRAWRQVLTKALPADGGCLLWQGARINSGYGTLMVDYRQHLAHRVACRVHHGPAPEGKPWVLHSCDVRACVAPEHLRWGTATENNLDITERSRRPRRSRRTACKRGHPFVDGSYRVNSLGHWDCRACAIIRQRLRRVSKGDNA